jgi:hypothetical protein
VVEDIDDNALILERLKQRLKKGLDTYGHGVRIEDDTKQFGSNRNDWVAMCEEEILDGLIYAAAAAIKQEKQMELRRKHVITLYTREQDGKKRINELYDRVTLLGGYIMKLVPENSDIPKEVQDALYFHLNEGKDD